MLTKLGSGVADEEVLTAVLQAAGRPAVPPPDNWDLGRLVCELTYTPKNKPFLMGEPTMPSDTQRLLEAWPAIGLTARWILVELCPCHDPRFVDKPDAIGGCYGCATDNIEDFGRVYSSKTSRIGFVEGIVSSLANWKLYAFGLKHLEWTPRFLDLDAQPRFEHPLRPADQPATAGTVVHTLYCCTHILTWYHHLRNLEPDARGAEYRARIFRSRVQRGIPLLSQLMPNATAEGRQLFTAMISWGGQMLTETAYLETE